MQSCRVDSRVSRHARCNFSCIVQLTRGGVSSNMTGVESKFTRHEKEIEVSQRFKKKRKASFEPPLAKQCPKHKVASP